MIRVNEMVRTDLSAKNVNKAECFSVSFSVSLVWEWSHSEVLNFGVWSIKLLGFQVRNPYNWSGLFVPNDWDLKVSVSETEGALRSPPKKFRRIFGIYGTEYLENFWANQKVFGQPNRWTSVICFSLVDVPLQWMPRAWKWAPLQWKVFT